MACVLGNEDASAAWVDSIMGRENYGRDAIHLLSKTSLWNRTVSDIRHHKRVPYTCLSRVHLRCKYHGICQRPRKDNHAHHQAAPNLIRLRFFLMCQEWTRMSQDSDTGGRH